MKRMIRRRSVVGSSERKKAYQRVARKKRQKTVMTQ